MEGIPHYLVGTKAKSLKCIFPLFFSITTYPYKVEVSYLVSLTLCSV